MNITKINDYILKEHTKQLENILTNVAIHYNLNKKELFEKFVYTKKDSKKHKNNKKIIDPQYICRAKTQTGSQCSRSKKFSDFCGKHSIHKNKCPLKGYLEDSKRSKKAEEDYIKNKVFQCCCIPKLGIISKLAVQEVSEHKIKSNHIIIKNETIQTNDYNIEEETQIVFDTNIKKPTVIGKKLSDNEIFFLSDLEMKEVDTSKKNTITSEIMNRMDSMDSIYKQLTRTTNDTSNDTTNDTTNDTSNDTSNDITRLLTKHSNIGDDYENFNTLENNIHTLDRLRKYSDHNNEEEEEDMDDINEELGLY